MGRLHPFLDLWFGHDASRNEDPVTAVEGLLTFNHPAPWNAPADGVQVLVVENQGVWLWGRDVNGSYLERENEPGLPWRETGETTEEFWLHHAAFEALWSMPAARSSQGFDEATIRRLEETVTRLPCRSWSWPGTGHSLFYRGPSLLMISDEGDGEFWVVASAPAETELVWLDELSLTWDEIDTRRE